MSGFCIKILKQKIKVGEGGFYNKIDRKLITAEGWQGSMATWEFISILSLQSCSDSSWSQDVKWKSMIIWYNFWVAQKKYTYTETTKEKYTEVFIVTSTFWNYG